MTVSPDTSVLYRSKANDCFLVDIPCSIESASGITRETRKRLVSGPPLQSAYDANAASRPAELNAVGHRETISQDDLTQVIRSALDQIRSERRDAPEWCLPRTQSPTSGLHLGAKRPLLDSDAVVCSQFDHVQDMNSSLRSGDLVFEKSSLSSEPGLKYSLHQACLNTEPEHEMQQDVASQLEEEEWDGTIINTSGSVQSLRVRSSTAMTSHFFLPPHSSCFLGQAESSQTFRARVRDLAQDSDTRKAFDVILLDPPWPNASARRVHKSKSGHYSVCHTVPDVRHLLDNMDLDLLLEKNGLIAIWITNKGAVRELVVGPDGLFASYGVQLIEEWVWVKTTIHGEPQSDLQATRRKPYEILLVGRKFGDWSPNNVKTTPRRRIIAAVPDVHSRKPCLKELLEDIFELGPGYRGLEIFARYLTSGWWSWGNEALKFNQSCYWVADEQNQQA